MAIAVVGSINQDLVVRVARHPQPGETVLGHGHFMAAGGKGANQAVAAARLGQEVVMIGRVGNDAFGHGLRSGLEESGVDVTNVRIDMEHETGLAFITLDAAAENAIVVSPGANAAVDIDDVDAARHSLAVAAVTLVQLEVPLNAVAAAVAAAGGRVVLNPAPAAELPIDLLARVDVLVPNRSELGLLAGGVTPNTLDEVRAAAARLEGPGAVVVTMGEAGALLYDAGDVVHFPAPPVQAIDTVGAGDAFCGALADALARGLDLEGAVPWGIHAGAVAVTRAGAQPSMPTRDDVERSMAEAG
jgi:ribokinase